MSFTTLSGANETPPNTSTGTDSMLVTLLVDTLTVDVTFSGLSMPSAAAHIHCCGPARVAEPIAVPLNSLPTGVTSGAFNASFNLTNASSYNSAFLTANGGTEASAEEAFITGLNGGQTYSNIHSSLYPGGEIRGQLTAITEPASILLAGGLLLFFALFRRTIV